MRTWSPSSRIRSPASEPPASSATHHRLGGRLVVIAYRDIDGDLHGINAWPATGIDLKIYTEGNDDGQDD